MNDRLLELSLTGQAANAAVHRAFAGGRPSLAALDQLGAFDRRAAHRAIARHLNRPRVSRTTLGDHLHDLRNHISSAANDHGIADHHTQARDLIHIVQRGIGYGDTRYLNRLETRNRRHRTGAAHLKLNVQQLGKFFHRRKFVGDSPARLTGTKAQLALVRQLVDLEHHTIDLIFQRRAALADIAVVIECAVDAADQLQLATDRQAPLAKRLQDGVLVVGQLTVYPAKTVAAELQRPAGGNGRVQLTQTAGSGVTRVGKGLAAGFTGALVQRLKARFAHEHFAAHLQHRRPALATQFQRYIANGTHVGGDVFSGAAIAPGSATHQQAVFVQQADRQPVQLRFAAVFDLCAATKQVAGWQVQPLAHPPIKVVHILLGKGITQAQHRHFMLDLAKAGRRCPAHTLRG